MIELLKVKHIFSPLGFSFNNSDIYIYIYISFVYSFKQLVQPNNWKLQMRFILIISLQVSMVCSVFKLCYYEYNISGLEQM